MHLWLTLCNDNCLNKYLYEKTIHSFDYGNYVCRSKGR
jgi:hypothetical protein